YTSSSDRNDIVVLEVFQPKDIYSQYIIRVIGKGYTVINHPSKVYKIPNTHKCIDRNQSLCLIIDINTRQKPDPSNPKLPSLDSEKITCEDLISRILVTYTDALSLISEYMPFLNSFIIKNLKAILKSYGIEKKQTEEEFKPIDNKNALTKAILNSHPFPELLRKVINIKEIEDALEVYFNFLSKEPSTTLICSSIMIRKMKDLRRNIETLSKKLKICNYQDEQNLFVDKWDVIIVQVESLSRIEFSSHLIIAILDKVNTIQPQHVLAINAFANESTVIFLKAYYNKIIQVRLLSIFMTQIGAEAMRIGFEFLKQGKRVAFVVTSSNIAQALVKKASKLSFKACAYYGDIDRK
ncbi:32261_t:CDS:2, partial [Gigaspora margarita]